MKKPLVSALTAALTFAACDDAQTPPVVHLPAPEPVIVVTAVRPVSASEPDSGTPLVQAPPPAPVDPLALAHERPGVDHLRLARQLLDDGDVRGALAEARRALFSSPDDTEVLELIATLGRQASQPSLSADAWGRIAAQRSTDAIPSIKQARAHL
ncbi:MAG: hypothetical protein INH37_02805, partial [Myxococcaceae bacterium]|nr:hypothetical protein [Myxococcaceae bacterium]